LVAAVRDGATFPLGLPLSAAEGIQAGFVPGRVNPTRTMVSINQPLSPDPDLDALRSGLAAKSPAIRDRGVKKAPFIVLIGANMPSILAEISFVSNPTDEHRLETAEYRQRIADSLYRGVANYVSGLSGVKVASKLDKPAGQ